jgi:Pyruvate/2-oxoacid:ferredoxin oxidoreductase gamma subunit
MENEPNLSKPEPSSVEEIPIIIQNQENQINTVILGNPDVIDSLANKAPKELLDLAEKNDKRQYEFAIRKNEQNFQLEVRRDNTFRLAMLLAVVVIISFLIYAGITKDKTLPDSLIKIILALMAGLGISNYFQDKKE